MPTLFLEILVMIVVELQKLKEAVSEECFEVYVSFSQPPRRLLISTARAEIGCMYGLLFKF